MSLEKAQAVVTRVLYPGPDPGPVAGARFKVVDSLSPCFRGDFPESVTDDRYVTSECEDP